MASRTQLRLTQLTGSVDDTKAAAAAISETSIQGVLDHLAASIKRIHGGSVFQNQTAGAFSQTIDVTGAITGSAGLNVGGDAAFGSTIDVTSAAQFQSSVHLSSDAAVLNFGADDDVTLTHVHDTGLLLNGASEIQFRDSALTIGSTTDGQLDIQADTELAITAPTVDIDASSEVNISNDLAVGGNITVTGDLTVNGTQTVLDTTSLVIEDSVIALSSGSAANADVNAAVIFQRNTANLGGDGDKTNGALMFLQGTGFKLGYTSDTAETAQGSLAVADDDLGELYVGQLSVGGASDNIAISGGALAATSAGDFKVDAATDIILDADGADIFFDDNGTRFGSISMIAGNSMLALSSSAGNSIALMSQGGSVIISNNDGTNAGTFDLSTPNEVKLLDATDRARLILDSASGDGQTILSGTVQLDNGADPAELVFKEAAANGSNTLTLDVPAAIGTSYTLTLPASNGSSGQVLKLSDANGNLEFGDATGDLARFTYKSTATIAAGNVDFGASKTAGIVALSVGTANLNITKSVADLNNALEVYVNGQLLISGSDGGADTDYTFIDADTLKFAFGLEADDIIQIIQR